ncbi:hypothetical protein LOK74_03855 [Brevibacillus humidisoli]|uniref:hypothetical protein n=1 Tax=Brevibacillus humidisoli TaxID=2895522 RepID=UPI001E4004A7|nr:hypothetical protein [Brevibacillus humidisoli]UFJ41659.1 hypothetical protein LOK74_03855 [Brevibacillus humidisoli]
MGDNGILLGKRQLLFYRAQSITLRGWRFHIAPGYTVIADGSEQSAKSLISIYRDSEKMARLNLAERGTGSVLAVEAIASEIKLEVIPWARLVFLTEKTER